MSAISTVEERLEQIEQDVALLKSQVQTLQPRADWLTNMTGSFKDDPEFDEILRLGQEQRRSEPSSPE